MPSPELLQLQERLQWITDALYYLYLTSAVLYMTHCIFVWKHWSWALTQTEKPWWIRCNLCWVFAGDGYFPLTNGRVVTHTVIAFVPFLNMALVYAQGCYLLVDHAQRCWKTYLRPWFGKNTASSKESGS